MVLLCDEDDFLWAVALMDEGDAGRPRCAADGVVPDREDELIERGALSLLSSGSEDDDADEDGRSITVRLPAASFLGDDRDTVVVTLRPLVGNGVLSPVGGEVSATRQTHGIPVAAISWRVCGGALADRTLNGDRSPPS